MSHLPVSDLAVSDFNFSSFCCLVTFSFSFLFLLIAVLLLLGTLKLGTLEVGTLELGTLELGTLELVSDVNLEHSNLLSDKLFPAYMTQIFYKLSKTMLYCKINECMCNFGKLIALNFKDTNQTL